MSASMYEQFLKALNEDQLERLVLQYVNVAFQTEVPAQRYGRKGQRQQGVDVEARLVGIGQVGFQAKAYISTTLTTGDLDKEIKAAHQFNPPLKRYTVITLNPRDNVLQEHARLATLHGEQAVSVLALQDLAEIIETNDDLKRVLYEMVLAPSDMRAMAAAMGQSPDATMTPLSTEVDGDLPTELRRIEDWINAGKPRRALSELEASTGGIDPSWRARLEGRAYFALGEYAQVVEATHREETRSEPSALVLSLGAYAAEQSGDNSQADRWLATAFARANEKTKPEVVAAYLRIHALRGRTSFADLERYTTAALRDPKCVAVALADAAFMLGVLESANHWYGVAQKERPKLPIGVQINIAVSTAATILAQVKAGTTEKTDLAELGYQLKVLLASARECEAPSYALPVLNVLGAVYCAEDRYVEAAQAWDEFLTLAQPDQSVWLRRCLLSAEERVPPPGNDLIARYATTHLNQVVLASALISVGCFEEAEKWIDGILEDPNAAENNRAIALVERLRLKQGNESTPEDVGEVIELLREMPHAVPLLVWATMHFQVANVTQQMQIRELLRALPAAELGDEQFFGLVSATVRHGLGDVAVPWLARLKGLAFGDTGDILHRDAAWAVADVSLDALQFEDAIRIRKELWERKQSDSTAALKYAEALFESGDRTAAYHVLTDAIGAGARSSLALRNWSMLAVSLGRRKEANRFIRAISIPGSNSTAEFTRLMQTQAILGLSGRHEAVLTGLSRGLVTPENAGEIFGVGVRRRSRPDVAVGFGTITHLEIEDILKDSFCLVEKPGPAIPGVKSLDAENHPWIDNLMGAHAGDSVELLDGPFQGKRARIASVRDAMDWTVQQAHNVISVSAPQATGVEAIRGEIDEQLAETRKRLRDRHAAVSETMRKATEARIPIVFLVERLGCSPRELLSAADEWIPQGHSGTTEDIAADDAMFKDFAGIVFDPISLLLLTAIGAEELVKALPGKPGITRHATLQLLDWYRFEREGTRATACLSLGQGGKMVLTEYGAKHRAAQIKHWRGLKNLIDSEFEILDTPAAPATAEAAHLIKMLGVPTASGMVTAASLDRVLISEEQLIRGAGQHGFGAKAASLHRLIVFAVDQGWISKTKATLWIAALIRTGWTWISFPVWMVDFALKLNPARRWETTNALLGRLRISTPETAISTLLGVLKNLDTGQYQRLDDSAVRKAVFKALPRVDHRIRARIAGQYGNGPTSRRHRASRRMLERWANEGLPKRRGAD